MLAPIVKEEEEPEENEPEEKEAEKEKEKETQPGIPFPVVPGVTEERETVVMTGYSATPVRLTVIPKAMT